MYLNLNVRVEYSFIRQKKIITIILILPTSYNEIKLQIKKFN